MTNGLPAKAALFLCFMMASGNLAGAQSYPSRVIEVIVPFAAGANSDLAARAIADAYSKALGPMVITNKDGAAGIIGTSAVASARPDGYTLGFATMGPITAQPHLRDDLRYRPSSFEYICQATEVFVVLSVSSESPHKSFAALLDYARKNPDKVTYAHPGVGSVPHLLMANLSARIGIGLTAVPFRGDALALNSLVGGHVDILVSGDAAIVDKGVRALAVVSDKRLPGLPEVPTTQELGLGSGFGTPAGLFAPKGLQKEVLERLRTTCATAAQSEAVIETMKRTQQNLKYLDGAAFSERIEHDAAAIADIIKKVGRPKLIHDSRP